MNTETNLGPAKYGVQDDGQMWLMWPDGLTLDGVRYSRASVQTEDNGPRYYLVREDGKDATQKAKNMVCGEAVRLRAVLVTPEAQARAQVVKARGDVLAAEHTAAQACQRLAEYRAKAQAAELHLMALERQAVSA